ncbi:hypothetical protein SEVIR_9G504800v4 [Setaria viridis]
MLRSTHPPSPTSGSSAAPASSSDATMVGGGGGGGAAGSGAPSGAKLLQILNVRVVGSGDRVVVLSHGFGTDQSAWSRVLPYLTRDHRVVLYDLVCAGSVNPEHFDFRRYDTLDSYVDDLLAILDALRIPRCAFVGHSVSAMIGILASIRRPELFAKLILIGASPRFLNDNDYHGGFELPEIQQVFAAMAANYSAWATGPTSAAAPPSSSSRPRATSRTSPPPASSPRCSAARSPGSSDTPLPHGDRYLLPPRFYPLPRIKNGATRAVAVCCQSMTVEELVLVPRFF